MPVTNLPKAKSTVSKYIVRHHGGDEARKRPCVHFITFGSDYGWTKVGKRSGFDVVLKLDLSSHQPPPPELCNRFTGQDPVLANSFFSIQENKEAFNDALAKLKKEIWAEEKRQLPGCCIAFRINCTVGRHRSVAMAEKLAMTVASFEGSKAECLHLDLGKGMDPQAAHPIRISFTVPEKELARRRTGSGQPVEETSEIRMSEVRARRTVATAGPVLTPTEAPLRNQAVSWGPTRLVSQPDPRLRKDVHRSAGQWRGDEDRGRRLFP